MARVLVTGATGFIGKRLIYQLLDQGHEVYALVRVRGMEFKSEGHPHLHILYGDVQDPKDMDPFPQAIDAAYYLIHSLGTATEDLVALEEEAAQHFLSLLTNTECRQLIFLGGIIEDEANLSPHLGSRLAVEKVLKKGKIPCTVLRSSIIIGSGSASFEIIRDLVEKLPFMIAPRWVRSYCQPIAIRDVLFYLTGVLLLKDAFGKVFDLGGPEALTFRDVLLRYARFRHLKRYILDVPVLTPRLSSYWLVLITTVRFSICQHLVGSMKQNTRKLNTAIDSVLPHRCISFEEALELAFQKIAQNEVVSTWMDAWDPKKTNADLHKFVEVPKEGCLRDQQVVPLLIPVEEALKRIWRIGGDTGWYSMNWAWRLRGLIDKMVGGAGFNRGRKDPEKIAVGDSIDFWRVLMASPEKKHLILYAEMKVPGEAWLEFEIDPQKNCLIQTATFRPRSVTGRLYWYSFFPFHFWIFRHMARAIAQQPPR